MIDTRSAPAAGIGAALTDARADAQDDGRAAFDRRVSTLPPAQTRELHAAFCPRQLGWRMLLDPRQRGTAVVFENGCGTAAAHLAGDFERVVAVVPDARLADGVAARARWVGAGRVDVVDGPEALRRALGSAAAGTLAIHDLAAEDGCRVLESFPWDRLSSRAEAFVALRQSRWSVRSLAASRACARLLGDRFGGLEEYRFTQPPGRAAELVPAGAAPGAGTIGVLRRQAARLAASGVGLHATRAGADASLVERLRRRLEIELPALGADGLQIERRLYSYPVGAAVILRALPSGARIVARVAFTARTAERQARNHSAIDTVSRAGLADVPRPLAAGRIEGRRYVAETMLGGVAIDGVRLASVETAASVAATVAQWLLQLRAATGTGLRPQGAATRRLVERDLPGAFAFLGLGPQDPACASLRTHVEKALRSSSLPLSMAHGDLSVDNVLLDAGGTSVAGVFDWDLADPCAVPLLDLLYFVATILRRRRGWGIGRCFAALFDLDALEPELGGIVDGHRRALGVNRAAVAPLIVLAWAHHVARRIEPPEPYPWAHHRPDLVEPFVPVAIERLQAAERSTAA